MHIRKYLSIFLIGSVFVIAGCSSDSSSGISEEDRLPDTDNDGIVDKHDPDIDGDGILNKDDADDDGDGTPDTTDPTPNGDGGEAPTPGLACTSAIVFPPKEGTTGRLNTASWELLPEGCETTVSRLIVVTASADQASPLSTDGNTATSESQSAYLGKLTTNIILPQDCGWEGETVPITYDFSEIGNTLGDPSGNYTQTVSAHVGKKGCESEPTPIVDPNFIVGPADNELTVNADGSIEGPTREGKAAVYAMANGGLVRDLKEPTWSSMPVGIMNIYINGGVGKNERITIEPGRSNGKFYIGKEGTEAKNFDTWSELQAEYGDYTVRTNFGPELDGPGGFQDPIPNGGNFVLRLNAATFKLNQYSVN